MKDKLKIDIILVVILAIILGIGIAQNIMTPFDRDQPLQRMYNANQPAVDVVMHNEDLRHPFLSFLVLHFFLKIGQSEIYAIMPSVLFGLCALILFYILLRQFYDKYISFILSLIITTNPLFLYYCVEVGGYTLFLALTLLSMILFNKLINDKPRLIHLIAYIITCTLMMYVHYFATIIIFCQGMYILISGRIFKKEHTIVYIIIFLLIIPSLITAYLGTTKDIDIRVISKNYPTYFWGEEQSKNIIINLSEAFFSNINLYFIILLTIMGIYNIIDKRKEFHLSILTLCAGSILIAIILPLYTRMKYEYFLYMIFPLLILIAEGGMLLSSIWHLEKNRKHAFLIIILLIVSATCIYNYVTAPKKYMEKGDYDIISNHILANLNKSSIIMLEHQPPLIAFEYYLLNKSLEEWNCNMNVKKNGIEYGQACSSHNISIYVFFIMPKENNLLEQNKNRLEKMQEKYASWFILRNGQINPYIQTWLEKQCTGELNSSFYSLYFCEKLEK
jgi:uncharacterized membrane protein